MILCNFLGYYPVAPQNYYKLEDVVFCYNKEAGFF